MHDALRPVFPEDVHHVAVRLAVVDRDRQAVLCGELELLHENLLLPRARAGVLPVVVEPDLTDRDDLRVRKQAFDLLQPAFRQIGGALRVDADRAVNVVVFFTQRDGLLEALEIRRHLDDAADALLRQNGAEQLVAIGVELLGIVVGVRIENHGAPQWIFAPAGTPSTKITRTSSSAASAARIMP